jgi:hypothetical protein
MKKTTAHVLQLLTVALFSLLIYSAVIPAAAGQTPPKPQDPAPVDSRGELWKRQRERKAENIRPVFQSGFERGLIWVEKKGVQQLLNVNIAGFRPKLGGLPTGSSFGFGTRYRLDKLRGTWTDLQSSATFSMKGYKQFDLQFGKLPDVESGAFAYAGLRYRDFPEEDFFGLGPTSRNADRTDFRFEEASYDGVIGVRYRQFRSDLRAGLLQVNIDPGRDDRFPDTHTLFNDDVAPGLLQQPNFFRIAFSGALDLRDRPDNPHNGLYLGFSLARYDDRDRNLFNFNHYSAEAKQYLSLGSPARVVALRLLTSMDDPALTSRVPFYYQQTLGGSDTLRGFREYRFRDRRLLYMSGEYRWEAVTAIEFVLFYDAGKAFSDRSDFDFTGLRRSYGYGIRFKTPDSVILRVDVGHSREGKRLYFKFGPSF